MSSPNRTNLSFSFGHRIAQPPQFVFLFVPLGPHLYPQIEKNACAHQALDLRPGRFADILECLASLADDDTLLRIARHVDRGADVGHILAALLEFVHDDEFLDSIVDMAEELGV